MVTSTTSPLDPVNLPPVPLVKIPEEFHGLGPEVEIYAQLGYEWPTGNLKHPMVYHRLKMARAAGELVGKREIDDSSSGNTAFAIAGIARQDFGFSIARMFVPADIPRGKEDQLERKGVILTKCYDRPGEKSAMEMASEAGEKADCFYFRQYETPENPNGHELYHIQPAYHQLAKRMTVYCAGTGTTGTINAALNFSAKVAPIKVVAGVCKADNPIPGLRTRKRLEQVPLAQTVLNSNHPNLSIVEIERYEAFRESWRLAANKIVRTGPSGGAAFSALIRYLRAIQTLSTWEKVKNGEGKIVAVFMCGDPISLYDPQHYRTILDPQDLWPEVF